MSIQYNRLDFPNMVGKQLQKTTTEPTETFFNPLIISGKQKVLDQKPVAEAPRTKIQTSLNSIVSTVHRNLKEYRPKKVNPPTEESDPKTEPTPTPTKTKTKGKKDYEQMNSISNIQLSTKQRQKPKFDINLQDLCRPDQAKSIPQIKANWEQKLQQRMRRNVAKPSDFNNFTQQQRLREVLHQKKMLEDILREHERIQRDRQSISVEIQSMKAYLNDIRFKLDNSLKKLTVKKTISEKYPKMKHRESRNGQRLIQANRSLLLA